MRPVVAAALSALALVVLAPAAAHSQALESPVVGVDPPEVVSATTLQAGKRYALSVGGTYREGDGNVIRTYDAAYCIDSEPADSGVCGSPPKIREGRGLLVRYDGDPAFALFYTFAGAPTPAFNGDSVYRVEFTAAKTARLRFALGRPGTDYSGALQVELSEATGAGTPPPSDPPPGGQSAGGNLAFHANVLVGMPRRGTASDISPRALPARTVEVGVELADGLQEVQNERLAAAIALALKKDPKARTAIEGCLLAAGHDEVAMERGDFVTFAGKQGFTGSAALSACRRALIDSTPVPTTTARAAAISCRMAFIPAFRRGPRVTKAMVAGSVAAFRRKLTPSCTPKGDGGLTARVRARAKGATLTKLLRTRIRAVANRWLDADAQEKPGETLSVRWNARKR